MRLTGKITVMTNHLLSCNYCLADVQKKVQGSKRKGIGSEAGSEDETPIQASHVDGGNPAKKKQKTFTVIAAKVLTFSPAKQVDFENQLLRACISAGWSFHSIGDPEVFKLFAMIVPGAKVPHRKKLSMTILRHEAIKMEGSIQQSVKGHYVTLQCDGWKDISKKHLLAFMFMANGEVCHYI